MVRQMVARYSAPIQYALRTYLQQARFDLDQHRADLSILRRIRAFHIQQVQQRERIIRELGAKLRRHQVRVRSIRPVRHQGRTRRA